MYGTLREMKCIVQRRCTMFNADADGQNERMSPDRRLYRIPTDMNTAASADFMSMPGSRYRYHHRAGANIWHRDWHMNVTTRSECSATLRQAAAKAIMTLVMVGGGVLCYPIHYITDVPTQQMIANSERGAERGDVITVSQSTAKTRVSCVRLLPPRTH